MAKSHKCPPPEHIPTQLVRHPRMVCAEKEKMYSLVVLNYLFLAERTESLTAAMQSQPRLLSVMQAEQSRAPVRCCSRKPTDPLSLLGCVSTL